jgi:hypothetical protein
VKCTARSDRSPVAPRTVDQRDGDASGPRIRRRGANRVAFVRMPDWSGPRSSREPDKVRDLASHKSSGGPVVRPPISVIYGSSTGGGRSRVARRAVGKPNSGRPFRRDGERCSALVISVVCAQDGTSVRRRRRHSRARPRNGSAFGRRPRGARNISGRPQLR